MIRAIWITAIFVFFSTFMVLGLAQPPADIEVGNFSSEEAGKAVPSNWKALHFRNIRKHTRYEVIDEAGDVAVKASANGSASCLIRVIRVDPKKYPIIQWRWKVSNILERGDVSQKQGDDYPARVFVAFQRDPDEMGLLEKARSKSIKIMYGQYPPHAVLNYIWASKAPRGLFVPNPYTDRSMMIVTQSGDQMLGRWITEYRNLYEDYKKAFKQEPPMISYVAIMTDTDNTGESATAYYADIRLKTAHP